jgi:hypothetical protein
LLNCEKPNDLENLAALNRMGINDRLWHTLAWSLGERL